MSQHPAIHPNLDLVLERVIDVPRHLVWEAWATKPEHLKVWFVPKPWSVSACEIDLRPGGMFRICHAVARRAGVTKCWLLLGDRTAGAVGVHL